VLLHREKALSDLELIDHYKASGEAFYAGVLFQRYTHLVWSVCAGYLKDEEESNDAVMEIFEHLTEALLKHEVSNFKDWLHVVTLNHCRMRLRREQRRRTTSHDPMELDEIFFVENDELEHLFNGEERETRIRRLQSALGKLENRQKRCIELFYLEGRSYKQISGLTGFTLNQIKSHIQNGKRNLKNWLTAWKD